MIEIYKNLYLIDVKLKPDAKNYHLSIDIDRNGTGYEEDEENRSAVLYLSEGLYLESDRPQNMDSVMFFIKRGIDANRKVYIYSEYAPIEALAIGYLFTRCVKPSGSENDFYEFMGERDFIPPAELCEKVEELDEKYSGVLYGW